MPYRYSQIDRNNLAWFEKDVSQSTLLAVEVRKGNIRGLKNASFRFRYPLTAIAGRNGTGKTTALALAACAFHNKPDGHNPLRRKYAYYTFSDFFVQAQDETPLEGVEIWYEILFNNWKRSDRIPDGVGRGWQKRWKREGGRWNDYELRVDRDVAFYGIERIVPHAERRVFRSYRSRFREIAPFDWEEPVRELVSRVMGKPYSRLWHRAYTGYRLPMLESRSMVHSGFNLGAGENALINVFSGILSCDKSLLLVIDELELGLHEEAQRRLVRELKALAESRHIQVVFTTHSPVILAELPPEARLFIEGHGDKTSIIEGISVDYAAGRLAGRPNTELDIFVEDEVAGSIIRHCFDQELRFRVSVLPIGSSAAIVRSMAARRKERGKVEVICMLDGDAITQRERYIDLFLKALESFKKPEEEKNWIVQRLNFLPGEAWPERWVVSTILGKALADFSAEFSLPKPQAQEVLEQALAEERHGEFPFLARALACEEGYLRERFSVLAVEADEEARDSIRSAIRKALVTASA